MPEPETPKIVIDSDWKAQAQAEKERLASQERDRKASQPAPAAAAQGPEPSPDAPIGFEDLVRMLATQALMYMGAFPDPQTGRAIVSLDAAKAHIDLVGVLETKTKGNLSAQETTLLQGILYELRMQYVEIGKAVEQAVKEGRISSAGAAGPTPRPLP